MWYKLVSGCDLQVGGYAKGQLPIHVKLIKLKILNEGMELDGLMDADESVYKGIWVTNYILAPGTFGKWGLQIG